MQSIDNMILTCIDDSIRINHYLEEVLVQTKDFTDIYMLIKQLRKNSETILNLLNIYIELKEFQKNESNDFIATIDFFNLNRKE